MLDKSNIQTQQKLVIIIYYCIRSVHFFFSWVASFLRSVIVGCADQFYPLGGGRQQKCARRVANVPWRRRTIATLRCCHSVYFQGSIHSSSLVFVSHSRAKVLFSLLSVFPLDISFFRKTTWGDQKETGRCGRRSFYYPPFYCLDISC